MWGRLFFMVQVMQEKLEEFLGEDLDNDVEVLVVSKVL